MTRNSAGSLRRLLGSLLATATGLVAQVQSSSPAEGASGLGGPGGLKHAGAGGLQGGRGLDSGQGGLRRNGGLQASKVEGAQRKPSGRLEVAKTESSRGRLNRATLKQAAVEITKDGITEAKLQGAASTIPESQVAALLYDIACELERSEIDLREVAVGYYMAALADPQGHRHQQARARLHKIFLDPELTHEEATGLYEAGLSTLEELSELKIGLTPEGLASGRRDLIQLKAAYHARPDRKAESEPGQAEEVEKAGP